MRPGAKGGADVAGTVLLDAPAPASGTAVQLSSGAAAVRLPASVTVAAGQSVASFLAATSLVASSQAVTISASGGGGTASAALTLVPYSVVSLSFSPSPVTPGHLLFAVVRLNAPAPAGGAAVAMVPGTLTASTPNFDIPVPAGATEGRAAFTLVPCADAMAVIQYTARPPGGGGGTASASVISKPAIEAFGTTPAPSGISGTLPGGSPTEPTIYPGPATFSAPSHGIVPVDGLVGILPVDAVVWMGLKLSCVPRGTAPIAVRLTSSSAAFPVPHSVTIPDPGTLPDAVFSLERLPVAQDTRVTVDAVAGPASASFVATLTAPRLATITFKSSSLRSSGRVGATLVVNGDAPAGGLPVALALELRSGAPLGTASSALGVPKVDPISIPATVTVPAGSRSATFEIAATGKVPSGALTVRATLNGHSVTGSLTLVP